MNRLSPQAQVPSQFAKSLAGSLILLFLFPDIPTATAQARSRLPIKNRIKKLPHLRRVGHADAEESGFGSRVGFPVEEGVARARDEHVFGALAGGFEGVGIP